MKPVLLLVTFVQMLNSIRSVLVLLCYLACRVLQPLQTKYFIFPVKKNFRAIGQMHYSTLNFLI